MSFWWRIVSYDISKEFVRRPEDRTLSVVRRIGRKLAKARLFGKRPFSKTSNKKSIFALR